MKKLGIIVNSLSRGGAERVSIYLARYFKDHDWDCDIITYFKKSNEYTLPKNIKRYVASDKEQTAFKYMKNVMKCLKESKPDVVLIMDTPLCTYAIPALIRLKIPFLVSERNDPTHYSGSKINIFAARLLMKKANGFIFQTNRAKEFYKKSLHNRGIVIPNPLITSELPEIHTGERKKIIVSVGRLVKQKNHKLLICAFAEVHRLYPEYELVIFGEGMLRDELISLGVELGLTDCFHLPGNTNDVINKIKDAYAFVLSSDFEGMPNALIEAMAMGLPCISTNCPIGGPNDLITNEKNGLLINVNDCDGLTKAIIRFIENNSLAKRCGMNAINIREKLDAEVIGEKWFDYISKTLSVI